MLCIYVAIVEKTLRAGETAWEIRAFAAAAEGPVSNPSTHPHGSSQPSVASVLEHLMSSSALKGTAQRWCTCIHAGKTLIPIKWKLILQNVMHRGKKLQTTPADDFLYSDDFCDHFSTQQMPWFNLEKTCGCSREHGERYILVGSLLCRSWQTCLVPTSSGLSNSSSWDLVSSRCFSFYVFDFPCY